MAPAKLLDADRRALVAGLRLIAVGARQAPAGDARLGNSLEPYYNPGLYKVDLLTSNRMILVHRRAVRLLASGLFVLVALLAPLKTVFACEVMERVSEQCCCEAHPNAECEQAAHTGECCDVLSLPEAKAHTLAASAHTVGLTQLDDDGKLPPALPPREVLPDPPASGVTSLADNSSYPLPWLHGSHTYLVTLRLRN